MINNNDDNENINQENKEALNEIKLKQNNNNINNNNSNIKEEEKQQNNINKSISKEKAMLNKEETDIEKYNRNYKLRTNTSTRKRNLKIKVSFRRIFPKTKLTREEASEKHRKENKIRENDLEGSQEGSSFFIKKGGRYLINDTKKILLISQSQKKYESKNDISKSNSKIKNKSLNNKSKTNTKKDKEDDIYHDEEEENEESDLSDEDNKITKVGGKLNMIKIKKKTELEKMRTGIETILKKGKRGKTSKEKEEEEKKRQRRKEREEKEKGKNRKEEEKNKMKEKIKKLREERIKKNKSEIKQKNNNKKYNKNDSNNKLKNKNDLNNINNSNNDSHNKHKNNNRNKSYKIMRSRKSFGKEIRILYNNENDNENDINNKDDINNIYMLRTQKLKPHLNQNNQVKVNIQPVFESIKSTMDTQNASNKYKTLFSEDQKNDLNDLDIKKRKKCLHNKYKANINIFSDPSNPYLTNWPKSFLKLGYNAGIWANKIIDGVPILRIQKLRPKLEFPPIYKIKYNQFSKMKNNDTSDDEENDFNHKKIYNNKYYFTQTNFKKNKNVDKEDKEESLDKKNINVDENNRTINVSKNI